jgi:ParB family transcriptional regulator, chromosome partitioning protein
MAYCYSAHPGQKQSLIAALQTREELCVRRTPGYSSRESKKGGNVVRVLARHAVTWFRLSSNVRQIVDAAADDRLRESLKKFGQQVPLIARGDGHLIDGYRRLAQMIAAGFTHADTIVTDEELTPEQRDDLQLITALHRETLHPYDQFLAFQQRLERDPQLTAKRLAEQIDLDPSQVSRILSLSSGVDQLKEMARTGKIGVKAWSVIAKRSPERQLELLEMKLNGASGESVAREGRKPKRKSEQATKRVRLPLPSGMVVTIEGKAIGMWAMQEELFELVKQIRKAESDGWDVATFAKVMLDRSKAKVMR